MLHFSIYRLLKIGYDDPVPNPNMISILERKFIPGVPYDQQSACIEYFFSPENWEDFEPQLEFDGSDDETRLMIESFIDGQNPEGEILAMLNSWLTDGF